MMAPVEIYALVHNGEVRYIGKARDAAKRLKGHIRDCRRRNTPLYCWLRKLIANGEVPSLIVIETTDEANWREAEQRCIAVERERNARLLNLAGGGDEPFCPADVRAKNGRATAKAIHADPIRQRIWYLKKEMGKALKDGLVSNSRRAMLRTLAAKDPKTFGAWTNLPDRVEA